MLPRLLSALRTVGGALVGALLAVICAFVVAIAISEAIGGQGGWAFGLFLLIWGVPIAGVAGGIFGGWNVAGGGSSRIFTVTAYAVASIVVLMIVLNVALRGNRQKTLVDAQGCTATPRVGSFGQANDRRYIVVYDRYCRGAGEHTVNVSVTTIGDTTQGPGNVLVVADDRTFEAADSGQPYYVDARSRDSLHLEVRYDHRARVVSRASSVRGFEVAFLPDTGRKPTRPTGELSARMEANMEEHFRMLNAAADSEAARKGEPRPPRRFILPDRYSTPRASTPADTSPSP